uniref:F-box domain-containing protein n=1 Tax=Brassica campestris TaxID=3711 RepID=M4D672_BRACM
MLKGEETSSIEDSGDFISSMPDDILHHIFSFIPTILAVKTSILSRRWRHAWCETPCLSFHGVETTARVITQTLKSYRALKITSFRLATAYYVTSGEINSWIKLAMSRSVNKLSVSFLNYRCPNFFFLSSSLEQLSVSLAFVICTTVSWKSLRSLTLSSCIFSYGEPIANILSGCPILETLELIYCRGLPRRLDLSKSLSLRRFEIRFSFQSSYVEIIAPQIHYLKLTISEEQYARTAENVERLTFGSTLLQILSLAELRGILFPTFNVQTLIVETMFVRSAIPGITRLLQNSPMLKKLIAQATCRGNIDDHGLDDHYLSLQGLNLDQCWRSEYIQNIPTSVGIESKLLASFLELVLRNSKTVEMMVVQYSSTHPLALEFFAQLLQMPPTLPHNNNVSLVVNPSNHSLTASVSSS